MNKCAILKTIVLKSLLISFLNFKCFYAFIILQLQTGLRGPILHLAEHLHIEQRILDEAAISADTQTLTDLGLANIALVLDLDELDICDDSANLMKSLIIIHPCHNIYNLPSLYFS